MGKKFSLKVYKATWEHSYGEQTTFTDHHVYFYKYDSKTKKHTIETYDLKTGHLQKRQEIKGITEMLPRRVRFQSYDFMVLQES
ncbi:hypothetical protein JOD24_002602 [Kroppenstedtia sanguinis]|uniref:Uncharacterized protein n=1 Tax=Kroppenstedtia sanguinis TaxID=1380684 RepID=A0ABW4C9J1_9BACL